MMDAQHTPGPWMFAWVELGGSMLEGSAGYLVWPASQNSMEALMAETVIAAPWAPDDQDETGHANARLIAAAPELLEALRQIERAEAYGNDRDGLQDLVVDLKQTARAAIAKATPTSGEAQ